MVIGWIYIYVCVCVTYDWEWITERMGGETQELSGENDWMGQIEHEL